MPRETRRIKLIGTAHTLDAYRIRDFLLRSVVFFDWIELRSDEECLREYGYPTISDAPLPIVILPDGTRLEAPTVNDLARYLGWVTEPRQREYDVSIYGAGPAGLSAAVYAASEGLNAVIIERGAVGGQASSSSLIENYMGFPHGISGAELAERGRQQAVRFGIEILQMREGVTATFRDGRIVVDLADGSKLTAKTNICATGVEWRRLGLPNENQYLGRGLYYGAGMSEASRCRKEHIYIVGGANSAGQAAMYLSEFADHVTVLVRAETFKGSMSSYLCERILSHPKIDVRFNTSVTELDGHLTLQRIALTDSRIQAVEWVPTERLFVCIGGLPNTDWAKGTPIIRDASGFLVTGADLLSKGEPPAIWPLERPPFHLETSVPGSFAAGDVRSGSVKRLATAVGEGGMAVSFVHRYLEELK
ncbi:MAG: FAD-dependent pyridine nucleotide-disulfide oxidoreductase [Pseudomonas sp.]|nr:FAD-dependent pyridine nucleotide-disulfide oxidoreductase [Pseudomonas sp.]